MSDNGVGVIIFAERAGRGVSRIYQKCFLPYLDSTDDKEEDARGEVDSEEEEKEYGDVGVGGEGRGWMIRQQGGGGSGGGVRGGAVRGKGEYDDKGAPHGKG